MSENKAWIAGAVIGPVGLVLALVIGGIFFFRRCIKRRKTFERHEVAGSPVYGSYGVYECDASVVSPGSQISPVYEKGLGRREPIAELA